MKPRVILLGMVAILGTGGCSTWMENTTIGRTAYVARVPAENEDAVRAQSATIQAGRSIQRVGCYLRKIDDALYLFLYLEKNQDAGTAPFHALKDWVEPLPEAARKGLVMEPMERIFYEAGAADKAPEADVMRIAMFTELNRDQEAHYRLLHDNPWPDVIAAIRKANFRHFSIFLEEINGSVYLFGWLEYVGKNLAADSAENKKDPASIRWWKETEACQIAPEDAGAGMWGGMEELLFIEQ